MMQTNRKNQLLEVFESDNSLKVDRESGIIRGVRILGSESRNKRKYLPEAMRKAIPLYEGRTVNANHERDTNVTRPIEDSVGWLKNVREEKGGLTGDLHLLKSDPRFEKICEAAERNPRLFGLSHDADGKWTMRDGYQIVEEIERVRSVDIVSDPATTRSLFESFDSERSSNMEPVASGTVPVPGGEDMTWQMFIDKAKTIYDGNGDGATKAKNIGSLAKTLFKIADQLDQAVNGQKSNDGGSTGTSEACKPDVKESAERARIAKIEAENLLLKAGVPVESALLEAVVALDTLDKKTALVETFKKHGSNERPRSASPSNRMTESNTEAAKTTDDFVSKITR